MSERSHRIATILALQADSLDESASAATSTDGSLADSARDPFLRPHAEHVAHFLGRTGNHEIIKLAGALPAIQPVDESQYAMLTRWDCALRRQSVLPRAGLRIQDSPA